MSAADPTLAIAAYLKATPAVNLAVEGRVFRPELPEENDPLMPRSSIVVRPAGGGQMFGRDYLPVMDSRLDITCYGSTRLESENVGREVAYALKQLQHSRWEEIVVFWCRLSSQPVSAIDPNTNWPFSVVVSQVMHSGATMN